MIQGHLLLLLCSIVIFGQCVMAQSSPSVRFDFGNLDGWKNDSAAGSPQSYQIKNGSLYISARAESKDRVKVATKRRFGVGKYSWRVYVPKLGEGDQASIGAFLYRDDKHEVDFEIGYGKKKLRTKLGAKSDDLVCFCTSQGHPYSSSQITLTREKWYTLAIELKEVSQKGQYEVVWSIDQKVVKKLATRMDVKIDFSVHCSVENLTFLGEHLPKVKPWAKFDYFEFTRTDHQ